MAREDENELRIEPGEAMLRFRNSEDGTRAVMAMVLNREGMEVVPARDMPVAQRRAWILYQLLTETIEGQELLRIAVSADAAMRDELDLSELPPQGTA